MNHKDELIELYHQSDNIDDLVRIVINKDRENSLIIADNCMQQKAVYTVVISLLVHKIIDPNQDIRLHQSNMVSGFSGRRIDTEYITPTLRQLNLPAMAESGWLTRSLEQPYPYDLNYQGKISNKAVKNAFLNIIDRVQQNPSLAEPILRVILHRVKQIVNLSKIAIVRIADQENISIDLLADILDRHFSFSYKVKGTAKLPVIAFYAIFSCLLEEIKRYESCKLKTLGSHTASDLKSKTAGDIEIIDRDGKLVEAIEIKHGREIDLSIVQIAKEKIFALNPNRYCIFSTLNINKEEKDAINAEVEEIAKIHGCQVIINGVIPTLKYYLRLISSPQAFLEDYAKLLESDREIQAIHKNKWNELINKLGSI